MRVLGVDPGLGRIGVCILEKNGSSYRSIIHKLISTPPIELPKRLSIIEEELAELIHQYKPDIMVTERLTFARNTTTALDVSKALGVILLISSHHNLPWVEFAPTEIKKCVTGVGSATKQQVQYMVMKLLGIRDAPKPDDVSDAIAIALSYAMQHNSYVALK